MNNSYKLIWINGKCVYYHRYIMEQHLGRKLTKDEQVHHINGNKLDNRLENLELVNIKKHCSIHSKERIANGFRPPVKEKKSSTTKKCYMKHYHNKIRGRKLIFRNMICPICNNHFTQLHEKQYYCSPKCRKIASGRRYWTVERLNVLRLKRQALKKMV